MYLSYYHLQHKPFQISTDPKFLWLGEKHEEALATLRYGILDNKGFLLLTGDVGTGKTTLINALLKSLGRNTLVATLRDPDLVPMDFFQYIAHAFGIEAAISSKGRFLIEFERFLRKADKAYKQVLLIIDEAQRLSPVLLEEIRLLSNIENEDKKLLNIFFVGQIEFNDILLRRENKAIRQRITVNYNIPPLTEQETATYLQHRLKIAGTENKLFSDEALIKIFSFSQGYPRLINIICDRSLLTGFVREEKIITGANVEECIRELAIPSSLPIPPTPEPVTPIAAEPAIALPSSEMSPVVETREHHENKKNTPGFLLPLMVGVTVVLACLFVFYPDRVQTFWLTLAGNSPAQTKQTTAASKTGKNDRFAGNIASRSQNKPVTTRKEDTVIKDQATTIKVVPLVGKESPPEHFEEQVAADKEKTQSPADKPTPLHPDDFSKLIIPFPTDSNLPNPNDYEQLDKLFDTLFAFPDYTISIKGYTDSTGNENYNRKLSEFRANAVKSYLVGKGLSDRRILVQGLGSQNPAAKNDTFAGRIINRRVEVEISK